CEAEIYAGAMAAQELHWLTYLLTDLGERPRSPPVLYVHNKAMLALCHEQRLEHRTKHIALRYFLARELQQRRQLRLSYVASRANTADVLTKALGSALKRQTICKGFPSLATAPSAASRGVLFCTSMAPAPAPSAKTLNPRLTVLKRTLSMDAGPASGAAKPAVQSGHAKKPRVRQIVRATGVGPVGMGTPVAAAAAGITGAGTAGAATAGVAVQTRQGMPSGGGAAAASGGAGGEGGRGGRRGKRRPQQTSAGLRDGAQPQQQQQQHRHHHHHHQQQQQAAVVQPIREVDLEAIKSVITDVRGDGAQGEEGCVGAGRVGVPQRGAGCRVRGWEGATQVPTIDRLLRGPPSPRFFQGGTAVRVLVLVPARELAAQVQAEAQQLLQGQGGAGSVGVQVVFGGTAMGKEIRRMENSPCQVLIATPGRLLDHLKNTQGMQERVQGVQVLVLDEADRMLDMGFAKDLQAIMAYLPAARQTLLFSATMPTQVQAMSQQVLRREFKHVDVVGEEDADTNIQVRQEHLVVPLEEQLTTMYTLLLHHCQEQPDYKVLVFSVTAKMTAFYAALFASLLPGATILEIHSRKSQAHRTRVSGEFRAAKGRVVMFTSDVSARGVDYPDVSLVLQVGLPADRAQYIHRLGRTGRAGKEGHGVLLLSPWEKPFLPRLAGLPITPHKPLDPLSAQYEHKLNEALSRVETSAKEQAYVAFLGYYNSNLRVLKWTPQILVATGNEFAELMQCPEQPAIEPRLLGKMGLRKVAGIREAGRDHIKGYQQQQQRQEPVKGRGGRRW
ncbi:unnamed protein product, partial [Closterium sp. NIES-54]